MAHKVPLELGQATSVYVGVEISSQPWTHDGAQEKHLGLGKRKLRQARTA